VALVGRSPAEVRAAIRDCDFVVDELYSDTPMATFATEAAAEGKPAVVGLYGLDLLRSVTPPEMLPPVQACHPDDLDAAIEQLMVDVPYRLALGERAREFVTRMWSPAAVAERFRRLLIGHVPAEWLFDPGDVPYTHGWGLRESQARQSVREVIDGGGVVALQLSDKPRVEAAFVAFARGA
jgi:hypothetical protein